MSRVKRLHRYKPSEATNICALIAGLETVLWPELGWQKVGMAKLISPGQVKVRCTKAISKLYPDKGAFFVSSIIVFALRR
jgi:hypothetical protein